MEVECPVCFRSFRTAGDRDKHVRGKQDQLHKQHFRNRIQALTTQFSKTVDHLSTTQPQQPSGHSESGSDSELPKVELNDVDANDLPVMSRDMDVDDMDVDSDNDDDNMPELYLDDEDSEPESENAFNQRFDNAIKEFLEAQSAESIEDMFNFLPDLDDSESGSENSSDSGSDLDSDSDAGSTSQADTRRQMDRALVEDENEPRTWQWHPTAGKVYGYRSTQGYKQWKDLFSEVEDASSTSDQAHAESYSPFASRLDWELAQWAVKEKVSQSAFDRLLQIPQMVETLGLSYKNSRSMLKLVDDLPEKFGQWFTKQLSFQDHPEEHFIVHHRDPVEAIKALWGDPSLANHLVYKPAKLFYGDEQKEENRMFSEMWTGSFWNAVQNAIPEGGTVCPVIIASDKTQLTRFAGNKAAYPVYLTIGNVPKALRRKQGTRACVLIAYLSVDKPSAQKNLSKKALKLRNYEIFHRSMAAVLEPLKAAGKNGVEMVGGDGAVRMVYPILSTYVADYPEQCLVTCTKSGCCPKCKREAEELELPDTGDARKQKWTYEIIQEACEAAKKKKRGGNYVHKYAMDNYDVAAGTYEPFWVGFPLTDIHKCIAPDILHQCYQGVFKHLISWVKKLVGMDEIDQRLKALPPACGVRHFKKGISKLNQVTATEHKHIARVFLASLVGKLPSDGVEACRSLLHFIHLAQNPSHDQKTLGYMTEELEIWHKKKSFFIRTGVREEFNIPKFHSLSHYVESIKWLGTTDNYNTEMFERYHIDFAKEAWEASNKRDYFPQMIKWLSRQEKICAYDFYKSWVDSTEDKQAGLHEVVSSTSDDYDEENVVKHNVPLLVANLQNPRLITSNEIQLTKYPHEPRKSIHHIIVSHKATGFLPSLKYFLNSCLPENQRAQTAAQLLEADLPFTSLDVWHHYKFTPINLFDDSSDVPKETIKSTPLSRKTSVTRFDTVIVLDSDEAESTAVIGCRIARVKVIFKLPQNVQRLSGGMVETASFNWPDVPLAYVTWYTRFKQAPDSKSGVGMYHVKPSYDSKGMAQGAIIPLSAIRQSCMLVPSKHAEWDPSWTSDNILDRCSSFLKRLGAFLKVIGLSTLSWISDMVMKQCAATEDVTPAYIKHDILPDLDLIGHTANYGAEFVPACEWMPICFELLDHAAVNSFGHIAKSLGAQDVLRALCSTIAIIIVAETGGPFTRIPAILNNKCPNRDSSVSASSIAGVHLILYWL
ncbi:hypothetical protein D9757_013661 [Collybiopsis confluens]|uniref:C2H2-type domain-containing protein n=1 Tax=Collybiopsis confluens TaxID=2823264 RepID=A0A8H5CSF8_9AGAR|nr:hypothetical protein D9757_013661 [Collybiopsis confluens]